MEIVLYVICILLLVRYCFVLYKYLKIGEFKKKVYKGNILGVIAYSFFTVFIICILLLMVLVSEDKSSDILMWIIFASGFGAFIMYPWSWQQRIYNNALAKDQMIAEQFKEEFDQQYGNEEYDKFGIQYFSIYNDEIIDEQFNSLINLITNGQISFIHPDKYKNVSDVFAYLFQEDYVKLIGDTETIDLLCESVNTVLRKNNIDITIDKMNVLKDDDEFMKARRKDLIPTVAYDLNKIDEILNNNLKDYELLAALIFDRKEKEEYPAYLCVVQKSKFEEFFKNIESSKELEGVSNE